MKCPDCGYGWVRLLGQKYRVRVVGIDGKIKKKTHETENREYFCRKCGWRKKGKVRE